MKRVTIKDVASEAGVSAAAVSRVFTNSAGSSEAMRNKVRKAAESLGYRPSMIAKGLVGERTNLITLVSGSIADPFDAIFLNKFSATLSENNMRLLLANASTSADDNDSGFLQAIDYKSDAVVVSAGTMPLAHSEACVKNGLPIVLMGRVVEQKGVDCVVADNSSGARMAAELLIRTGCTNLVYLGRGAATYSDRERMHGFVTKAKDASISVSSHTIDTTSDDHRLRQDVLAILTQQNRPDGIFCSSDVIAFAVIEAARSLAINIPDELSLVGFNNIPQAGWPSFDLTTINLPINGCIETAMRLLSRRLEQPDVKGEICRVPVELVIRSTTRRIQVKG